MKSNMGYNSGYRKDIKRAASFYCETAFLLGAFMLFLKNDGY
jgi:hypothetical protein